MLKLTDFGLALMEKEQPKATLSTSYHPPSEVFALQLRFVFLQPLSYGLSLLKRMGRHSSYIMLLRHRRLCGYPPYFSIQEDDFSEFTQQKIVTGEYLFPADQWDKVSLQGGWVAKSVFRIRGLCLTIKRIKPALIVFSSLYFRFYGHSYKLHHSIMTMSPIYLFVTPHCQHGAGNLTFPRSP
uniref:Protein kinase domain-containing protein n=1 Tax=Parascaris equorum TaxID=6256 RepID=A0A914S408_PAREQ